MTIAFAPRARRELDAIWDWNDEQYGPDHADAYLRFLQDGIDLLADEPERGRSLAGFPGLRVLTLRQNAQGHGHMVIYRVDEAARTVRVLHVYHTAQDWQGHLKRERS